MAEKETIKVKNVYCERLGDNITQQILNRSFPVKTGYWISRIIEKIRQESKIYFEEKDKLIKKHEDVKKAEEEKKKGDCDKCGRKGELPAGQTLLKDVQIFQKELLELQAIDINLEIEKVKVDLDELGKWFKENNEKELTIGEMEYLIPFLEIKGA